MIGIVSMLTGWKTDRLGREAILSVFTKKKNGPLNGATLNGLKTVCVNRPLVTINGSINWERFGGGAGRGGVGSWPTPGFATDFKTQAPQNSFGNKTLINFEIITDRVSEGYVFTGMCHSLCLWGGGVSDTKYINASWDRSHGLMGDMVWSWGVVQSWGDGIPFMGERLLTSPLPSPPQDMSLTSPTAPPPITYGNYGQWAGGSHSTGMHSCSFLNLMYEKLKQKHLVFESGRKSVSDVKCSALPDSY